MLNVLKLAQNNFKFYYQYIYFLNNFNLKIIKKINFFNFNKNYIKSFKINSIEINLIINQFFLKFKKKNLFFNNKTPKYINNLFKYLYFLKNYSKNLFIFQLKKSKYGYSYNFLGITTIIPKNLYKKNINIGILNKSQISIKKKKLQSKFFKKIYRSFFFFLKNKIGKNILFYLQKTIFLNRKIRQIINLSKYTYNFNFNVKLKSSLNNTKQKIFPIKNPLSKTKWSLHMNLKQNSFLYSFQKKIKN